MQVKDDEFSKAFNADQGNEVSSEAPEGGTSGGASNGAVDAVVIDPTTAVNDAAEDAGIDTAGAAAGATEGGEGAAGAGIAAGIDGSPTDGGSADEQLSPEDLQRQRSWEGRMRKREEELAAREAALGNTKQEDATGDGSGGADDAEIAEIKQRLTDDFGDDFVGMISKLAAHEARKLVGADLDSKLDPINKTIAQAIQDVHEAFESMHFGAIAEAHENFRDVIDSPEFAAYINGLSGEEQEAAQAVLENGTPKQVIALLTAYKDSLEQKADTVGVDTSVEDALDAAEGVRGSSPVQLPERVPVGDEDEYKSAWDSM